jgi:hypothetical protein
MRWMRQHQALLRKTNDSDADGEVVWSWPPDAEAKFASCSTSAGEQRGQESQVPGESAYKL